MSALTSKWTRTAVTGDAPPGQPDDLGQTAGESEQQAEEHTTDQTRRPSPRQGVEDAGARPLGFAVNRVGLVEEPEPQPIRDGVDQPHQQPVDDVPYQ